MRIAVLAVLALLVSPVHADDWHEVKSSGGFEISFPKAPKESTQTNASGTITLTQYWLQDGNTMWMATWNDGPDAATATPDEVLNNMRDGTLQKLPSAKLISEKKLMMNGHPGRELTIGAPSEPTLIAVARLYLVNKKRLFTAMVVNDKKAGAADRKRFLDSFKLVSKKAAAPKKSR